MIRLLSNSRQIAWNHRRVLLAKLFISGSLALVSLAAFAGTSSVPEPPGKLVDLGGHRLHVNCTGQGSPTVVVENGLGDFSFDWTLVQSRVSRFSRICTYDRGGYAWSDPGPKPRTFAQLNLELHDALGKLGEKGPFILVGHSYGGPVVRNYVVTYPSEVAGVVLVDAAFEGEYVGIGGHKTIRLGEGANGASIPAPHENMSEADRRHIPANATPQSDPFDPMYSVLPAAEQKMQLWAQSQPQIGDAEGSQLEWSGEYFAEWLKSPQAGKLGAVPLMVLTRAEGGYGNDLDVPAAQMEKDRKEGQAKLTSLTSNSKQVFLHSGHNMELDAPDEVAAAIREVVEAVRQHKKLVSNADEPIKFQNGSGNILVE